jgi:PAS domain S-box-containing protein
MSPKRADDLYRALFDSTTVRIWHIDPEGRILRANSAVSSYVGLPMKDLVGKRLRDFISPEEAARLNAENREIMRSGTPKLGVVEKYSVPGGRTGWVRTDKIPYYGADGEIAGLMIFASEITEHRETEEALRTSQLQLSEAMELARIVYWEYDPHTDEFILNDPFYAFYGTTAEQEGGYRMAAPEYGARFVHPDDLPRYVQLREENPPTRGNFLLDMEHRIVRRDGQVRHILVRIRRVEDGAGAFRLYGTNQDITERKAAEEALKESEARYRSLFDDSPIALMEMDGSAVRAYIDRLRASGVEDLGKYADDHPEAIRECHSLLEFTHVNKAALDLCEAPDIEAFRERSRYFVVNDAPDSLLKGDFLAIAEGTQAEREQVRVMRSGKRVHIHSKWSVAPGHEKTLKRVIHCATDMTKSREAEEALRESEEKFRLLFEKSPDATFLFDGDTCLDCNEAALKLIYWMRKDQLIGSHPSDFAPERQPDGRLSKEKDQEHRKILLKEGAVGFEWLSRAPDGREVWHDVSQTLVPIQGKKIVHSVARDITERKRVEEALRESEEKFRLLFEKSPDATLLFDEDTCIDCNEAGLKLIHWVSKEQLIGSHPPDFAPERQPDGRLSSEKSKEHREILLKEGAVNFEWLSRAPDGREFWRDVSQTIVPIQGKRITFSISRDITERKKAVEALRTTRLQLSEAMDLANIVYWEIDPTCETFIFNDPLYALHSTTAEREGGYTMAVEEYGKRFIHPDDLLLFQQTIEKIRSGTAPEFSADFEHRIIRRDGEVRHILARSRGMRDSSGLIARYYGASQDITKRKEAEEENSRLQSQLLQAQKMEAIGTLAGGVAHDFNNILSVITGFANLAQMSTAKNARLRPYIDQVVISAERAAELTQSLLAFSRKQNITLAPRDINSLVRSTAKLLERLLHEDIKLKLQLTDKRVIAEADVTQMDQVLMNLATNARDAMPHGGSFLIRTDVANLDKSFERAHGFGKPGTYVHLSVSDTGMGMDEKTTARIFEPFFTTKEAGKGTGLGLASVYGVVKQHGGYITVTSRPLKGTTFDIYLPMVEMREYSAAAGPAVKGGHETILVVEDDSDVRRLVTQALSDQGYAILEAADGDSAIRTFKKHRRAIGLIIIDVVVPGRNGKEVLDEITRTDPGIKAIFMSGYTGDIIVGKGVKEESVDFLQKPLSVPSLLSKVREVLDRQDRRR